MSITFTDATDATGSVLLTTLARIKARLGIAADDTTQDARLTELEIVAGKIAERWTGITFLAADYVERYGVRGPRITLQHAPVQYITRVATGQSQAIEISFAHATDALAEVRTTPTGVTLTRRNSNVATSIAFADQPTVQELSNAIGVVTGFDSEVLNDLGEYPSAWLVNPHGATAATVTIGNDSDTKAHLYLFAHGVSFGMDAEQGQINSGSFLRGNQSVEVRYRAGYDDVPEDVMEAVAALVAVMQRRSERNAETGMQAEKIGAYSYNLGDGERDNLEIFSPEAHSILSGYKRHVLVGG